MPQIISGFLSTVAIRISEKVAKITFLSKQQFRNFILKNLAEEYWLPSKTQ